MAAGEEANTLGTFLTKMLGNLGNAFLLDSESRAILEAHYLKAESEILRGYQEVIDRRLEVLQTDRQTRKIEVL